MNKFSKLDHLTPYETDYAQWSVEQARLLRDGRLDLLDRENLAEEIDALARKERKEIRSRMRVLITHLLKWQHQPDRRCNSWQTTISSQRIDSEETIIASPSLKTFPAEALEWSWKNGRRKAAEETGLDIATFPDVPEFTAEQILDFAFMPGQPWHPDDLIRD